MAKTTAFLKSAQATQTKVQAFQDQEIAFEWQNSAQTYDDFQQYSKYLQDRAQNATDPSKQLTYQTTIRAAQRSFTSNELQRQQMDIMEGNASTTDKMDSVRQLYSMAVANGDNNLAQNLASQFDTLSIKAQNEADAAQKAAQANLARGVASDSKQLSATIDSLTKGSDYVTLPDGTTVAPIAKIANDIKSNGKLPSGVNAFVAAQNTMEQLQTIIKAAYEHAPTQEAADSILKEYGGYFDGTKTVDILGQKFNANDLINAAQNENFNNPLYSLATKYNPATGQNENKLQRNENQNFQYIRTGTDPTTGQDLYTPIEASRIPQDTGKNQSLDTQITDQGSIIGSGGEINAGTGKVKTDTSQTVQNRLANLGIQATKGENGTITITLPTGETYNAIITPSGDIRYFGAPGQYSGGQPAIYEISLTNKPNFYGVDPVTGKALPNQVTGEYGVAKGQIREVAPDEASIFGDASSFGGQLSKASATGGRTVDAYSGKTPTYQQSLSPTARITNPGVNDFSATGSVVGGGALQGTTGLLRDANVVQTREQTLQLQAQQVQAQQAAQQLQAANVANLNQTPVQQYAQNGAPIRQLTVARPAPTPQVSVAAPAPYVPITGVGVAHPATITGVGVAAPQPRVYVGP